MEGRYNIDEEELEKPNKKKSKRKKKKKINFGKVFLVIMFVAAIVAGNRAAALRWQLHGAFGLMNTDSSAVIKNVDAELLKNGVELISSDDIINILLVGADKRESWNDSGRSDSCMIATIDLKHNKLKLSSIMRDMYVEIPGYEGKHKFNSSYSKGGVELLYKTILHHFGIKIDGYAIVDFAAFRNVINKLGGVNITLTDEEYTTLMSMYHRTSVLDLKPGKNKMNGTQALAYCRLRKVGNDFGRTERQRTVIDKIFKKMKKKPVNKWFDVLKAVMPEITTDLPEDKIIEYMQDVIFMGTTYINQFRVPIDGSWSGMTVGTEEVLDVDIEKNREALKKFIYEE